MVAPATTRFHSSGFKVSSLLIGPNAAFYQARPSEDMYSTALRRWMGWRSAWIRRKQVQLTAYIRAGSSRCRHRVVICVGRASAAAGLAIARPCIAAFAAFVLQAVPAPRGDKPPEGVKHLPRRSRLAESSSTARTQQAQ